MRAIAIAVVEINKQLERIRLLRIPDKLDIELKEAMETIDVTPMQILKALKSQSIDIVNIRIKNNKIAGYGARLDRYTKLDAQGNLNGKSSLVVLGQIKSDDNIIGYIISDHRGKVIRATLDNVISYIKTNGIANGKLVSRDNKMFISPIIGEYEDIVVNKQSKLKNWTREEFKEYMDKHGYNYSLINETLNYVDDKLDKVVVPEGVQTVNQFKMPLSVSGALDFSSIKSVYLPSTIYYIANYAFDNLPLLQEVIIDNRVKHFNYRELNEILDNGVKVNIPTDIERLVYHSSFLSKQLDVDYSKLNNLQMINMCCRGVQIDKIFDIGNPSEIKDSVVGVKGLKTLKIPRETKYIQGSFTDLGIDTIDFSEAVNLEVITNKSFCGLNNVKKIDLSNCKQLRIIGYESFSNCGELEEVILPNNLQELKDDAFMECPKLKEVVLPKKLEIIGDNVFYKTGITNVTLPSNVRSSKLTGVKIEVKLEHRYELPGEVLKDCYFKSVTMPDSIETWAYGCMAYTSFEFNIPSNLRTIGDSALYNSSGPHILDFSNCARLKSVGGLAFENNSARVLVLPDSLETIGHRGLRNMAYLKKLYLPQSITDMGARCLQGIGRYNQLGTIIYVYKGSYADNYCKRNKLKAVYVNSIDEVLKDVYTDDTIDIKKETKLKLMLSNDPIHSKLLDKEYINDARELYKLYLKCTTEYNIDEAVLIKGPKSVDVDELFEIDLAMVLNRQGIMDDNVISNYIKLLMKIGVDNSILLDKNTFRYMRDNKMLNENRIVLEGRSKSKAILRIPIQLEFKNLDIYIIIVSGKAVFCTVRSENRDCRVERLNIQPTKLKREPIEGYLKTGTSYSFKSSNSGDIPAYIANVLKDVMEDQFRVVGMTILKDNQFGALRGLAEVYLYNVTSGNIIKAQARCNNLSSDIIFKSVYMENIGIINIESLDNISDNTLEIVRAGILAQKGVEELIYKAVLKDDYIRKLIELPDAYDEPAACFEWELANELKAYGFDLDENMNHAIVEMVLNTAFFYKTKKKSADLKKMQIKWRSDIENGAYELITFVNEAKNKFNYRNLTLGKDIKYTTVIINKHSKVPATIDVYNSDLSIYNIYSMLLEMVDKDAYGEYYLDDTGTSTSNFYITSRNYTSAAIDMYGEDVKFDIGIGINKASGVVYLLGGERGSIRGRNRDNGKVYKLFRYNTAEDALLANTWIISGELKADNIVYGGLRSDVAELLANIIYGEKNSNQMIEARRLIMEGYPNRYAVNGLTKHFFELAAKQRKQA